MSYHQSPWNNIIIFMIISAAFILQLFYGQITIDIQDYKPLDFTAVEDFPPLRMVEMPEHWYNGKYYPGHSERQLEIINYAYEKYKDREFLYLLKAENGWITHDRRHNPSKNKIGVDWGFCGTNDYYHKDKVSNPLFMSDWKWQLDQCWQMYKGGTKFYADTNKVKHFFKFND